MLKNSYKLLFFLTLFFGSILSISSSSWFSIWMGLEINLLSFIPLMMSNNNLFSSEASLKYFLTQAMASSILLFSIIFFSFIFFQSNIFFLNFIFSSMFMLKSGMAPFHFWFPNVSEGLNWNKNFILLTWQKIAPLILLTYCLNFYFFIFSIFCSIFFGSMGGLNQTSLRKLLAYSSINHLGWMMSSILNNENLWKIYFLIYCFSSFSIMFLFKNFNFFFLNQLFSFFYLNKFQKSIIFIPMLSLGGLPPFLGFFPKWLIIEMLIINNFLFLIIFMINFTLITLYFYIRICYSSFLMNFNEMNFNLFSFFIFKKKLFLSFLLFFSIFGLFFLNIIFLFI